MRDPLEYLAGRVTDDPNFLAWGLACYARSERLDDAGLAAALRCRVEDLTRLRLCRTPPEGPPGFAREVDRIAARFGLDADVLAEAVRRGCTLRHLRRDAPAPARTFLAARDAPPPQAPPEGAGQ